MSTTSPIKSPIKDLSSDGSCLVEICNIFLLFLDPGTVSRKIFNSREPVDSIPYDHDENKYQRRGAIDWFTRWFW